MIGTLATLYRTFGARGIARRAAHELRRRANHYTAAPVHDIPVGSGEPGGGAFNFEAAAIALAMHGELRDEAIARASRVAGGEYQAFGSEWRQLPRSRSEWNTNPLTGHPYPGDAAWWTVPLLGSAGDVKSPWEPARFGWAYDLMRGYAATGDERLAEAFWTAVEQFAAACPPMRGVQWACGQETAIRAVALLWAESAFAPAACTTPARRRLLRVLLHASGERIADAIGYALSQRNNHAISEAVGLVVLGARFHDASPPARTWYHRGAALLPSLVNDQVAADGWYIQHSFTYTRLALDMLVTGIRSLRARGDALPPDTMARIAVAARLLALVTDADTGDVPNHGPNDGAHVLPLAAAGYRDFRPALTAAFATLQAPLPAPLAPCAMTLAWLGAAVERERPAARSDQVVTGSSGWVFVRRGDVRVFARAGSYDGRPGHIDALHVDIWNGAQRVAVDAGTYRYNAPPPWDHHALSESRVHNTVTIPRYPMARRGPRFLWLSTPSASVDGTDTRADAVVVSLSNHSWAEHGIAHHRTVEVRDRTVRVSDELRREGAGEFDAELHWLCAPGAGVEPVIGASPAGTTIRRLGDELDVRGWESRHYGVRTPAPSFTCAARSAGGQVRFVTTFDLTSVPGQTNG